MRYQDGLKSLKFQKDKRYVLSGSEPYLKEQFVRAARTFKPDSEFVSFYPQDEAEISSFFYSDSLFEERVVVLRNYERMKAEKFLDLLEKSQDCVIALLSEKANMKAKAITKLVGMSVLVECNKMREYGQDYPSWISSKISDAGYTAEDGVNDLIYDRIGANMFALSGEIKKLLLYREDTKSISEMDAKRTLSFTASNTAYEILEEILKRNVRSALVKFRSYTKTHDNFVEIAAFFSAYMEKMYRMLHMRGRNLSQDDIADIVGIPKFIVKTRYMPRAMALGLTGIAKHMDRACTLGTQLRIFKGDKKLLVENFIMGFAQ